MDFSLIILYLLFLSNLKLQKIESFGPEPDQALPSRPTYFQNIKDKRREKDIHHI